MAGWPTTYGSRGASRAPATTSDPVVAAVRRRRLRAARQDHHAGVRHRSASPRATPWASPATRGTRTARRAGRRAGPAPRWPPGWRRSPTAATAAARSASRRRATAWSGSSPPAAGSPATTSSSRAWSPTACSPASVADAAAALDVLALHDPAAWWSPPSPRGLLRRALDGRRRRAGCGSACSPTPPIDGLPRRPGVRRPPSTPALRDARGGRPPRRRHRRCRCPRPTSWSRAFGTIWNIGGAGDRRSPTPTPSSRSTGVLRDAARAIDSWTYAEAVQHDPDDVAAHRRSLRRRLRPAGHAHDGVPAAAGRRVAGRAWTTTR